jgi:hypothetical protein
MMVRGFFPIIFGSVLLGSACFVDPADLDDDANLFCEKNEDCPPQWLCKTVAKRCVPRDELDQDAPRFAQRPWAYPPFISHQQYRKEIRIYFVLEEDVGLGAPGLDVSVWGNPLTCDYDPEPEVPGVGYECLYTIQPDDPEGETAVLVIATDASANSAIEHAVVDFDYTPPTVQEVIITPNDGLLSLGEVLTVMVIFNEPIGGEPELRSAETPGMSFEHHQQGDDAGVIVFSLEVVPGTDTPNGVHTLALHWIEDQAGNPLPDGEVVGQVTIDTKNIAIYDLQSDRSRYSRVEDFDGTDLHRVQMQFQIDNDAVPENPRIRFAHSNEELPAICVPGEPRQICQASYVLTAFEPEGLISIIAELADAAGNLSTSAASPFFFDFSPPLLPEDNLECLVRDAGGNFEPAGTLVTEGVALSCSFFLDENAAVAPVVSVPDQGWTLVQTDETESHFVYEGIVPPGPHAPGATALQIWAVDEVGNEGIIDVPSAFSMAP